MKMQRRFRAVLLCVALSVISWRPQPTPPSLVTAGVASGSFGTATSIGGPPLAVLYQHHPPSATALRAS